MKTLNFRAVSKIRYLAVLMFLTLLTTNAWGAEETITLSDMGWGNATTQTSITATSANIVMAKNSAGTAPKYYTSDGLRIYGVKKATTGGTISFTAKTGITISKIVFTHTSSNSGVLSIKSGGGSYSSKTWTGTLTAGNTVSLVVTNNTNNNPQVKITKIVITYTAAASCTTSPTVGAGSNSAVTSTTATVSCSSGISSLGSAGCSISSYGFVIGTSANPTVGGSGVTKHQVGTTYTSTGASFSKDLTGLSAETTYYVRPYATNGNGTAYGTQTFFTTSALPKYTVTLKDDNSTLTQASAGASVTLPSRTGCTGYTFAGWTKSWATAQTSWTTTAPTIIPAGSYTPTANENLYPVYTKEEGGGGSVEHTTTFDWTPTSTTGTSFSQDDITATFAKASGGSTPVYNATGTAMRLYYKNTLTFTGAEGITLKSIVFTTHTSNGTFLTGVSVTEGSFSSKTWSDIDANSATLTNGTVSSGHTRIQKAAVTFTTTGGSTTYYISVPNCCTTYAITLASSGSVTGGTFSSSASSACADNTVTLTPTPATGYQFGSWDVYKTGASATKVSVTTNQFTMPAYAVTVNATFNAKTYAITLNKNGGSTNGSATATYNSSSLTSVTHATWADHELQGYYTETSSGIKVINANGTLVANVAGYTDATGKWIHDGAVTLHAQWAAAGTNRVTITAPSNGTISVTYTGMGTALTSGYRDITENTVLTITATPATGYTLGTLTVGGSPFTSGNTHNLTADITIAATFTAKTYNVTLDREGATTGSTSVTMTYNSATHTSIIAPTKAGYTFGGWWSGDNGTGSMVMNASGVLQANVSGYTGAGGVWTKDATCTLYAKWTTLPTVTFDAENGTCATTSLQPATVGGNIVLPSATCACTALGWSFYGWATSSVSSTTTTPSIVGAAGANYAVSSDVTLHAVYKKSEGGGASATLTALTGSATFTNNYYYIISTNRASTAYAVGNEIDYQKIVPIAISGTANAGSMYPTSYVGIYKAIKNGSYWNLQNEDNGKYLAAIASTTNKIEFVTDASSNYAQWTLVLVNSDANSSTYRLQNRGESTYYLRYFTSGSTKYWGCNTQTDNTSILYLNQISTRPTFGTTTYNSNPDCPTHEVTIGSHTNGTIEVNGSTDSPQTVGDGATVSLTATPASGYRFTGWTATNTSTSANVTSTLLAGAKATTASTDFTMPAYNVTISATFEEIVNYSVKWSVDGDDTYSVGTPTTSVEAGTLWSSLTLPTAPADNTLSDCDRTTFAGWTTSPMTGDGNSAPAVLFKTAAEAGSTAINTNTTFYAVFSIGGKTTTTVSRTTCSTSATNVDGTGTDTHISISWQKGGAGTAPYNATNAVRLYQINGSNAYGGYVTLTAASGCTIKSVSFTSTDSYTTSVKYSTGTPSSGPTTPATAVSFKKSTTYTVSDLTCTQFTLYNLGTGSSGRLEISGISVTYESGSEGTDYVTECCSLAAATGLSVSSVTSNSVSLSWTAPSPTTGISKLQVVNADNGVVVKDGLSKTATSATITGLTECTTYNYKVVSYSASCTTSSPTIPAQPFSGAKTVTFNYHSGTGTPASFTSSCSGNTTTLPTTTRSGYRFLGWYSAASGGTRIGDAGASYTVTGTTTIHAQWAQEFTVTYNYDGGTSSCADATKYISGQTVTVCSTPPTKLGYTFGGWLGDNGVGTKAAGATFTMPSANVTLTAQWSENRHTINYIVPTNGGSAVSPTTSVLDGYSVTLPNVTGINALYSCETFLGWTTTVPNADGGKKWSSTPTILSAGSTSAPITANTTYYAVYSRSGGGASGNTTLSNSTINSALSAGNAYGTSQTLTEGGFTWTTTGYAPSGGAYIQLKSAISSYYVKTPTMAGNLTTITINYTAVSTDTRTLYFNTSASTTGAVTHQFNYATGDPTSGAHDVEIDVSSLSATSVYIGASTTFKINAITVNYGPAPVISHNVECPDCEYSSVDIAYDANTSYFAGSTTSCTGEDDYVWEDHDGKYTICSTEPTLAGYKFIGWNVNANGSGESGRLYQAEEEVSCFPSADVTLYAQYERVYTITFNDQSTTTNRTQASAGAAVSVPSHTTPCVMAGATWEFAGWSKTGGSLSDAATATIDIAADATEYTPVAADDGQTFYAVYKKTLAGGGAFSVGKSGSYKFYYKSGSTNYWAKNKQGTYGIYSTTTAGDALSFRFTYYPTGTYAGKYTIQNEDGEYIGYSGSSTSLEYKASAASNHYYWTITASGTGFIVQNVQTATRYLASDGGNFNAKTSSDNALIFEAAAVVSYFTNMACTSNFSITFDNGGGTINWAVGHAQGTYEDVADGTVFSTFPTATYDGWTFIGWTVGQGYSDMAKYSYGRDGETGSGIIFPEDADIYGGADGTSGNSYTIHSNVTMYPIFTQFPDNEQFDVVNGGDYYIYYLASGSDDGYGDEKRMYAATYNGTKSYNATANCGSATEFTFTKLANGKWTIYDKKTGKYLSDKNDDWLCQSTTPVEWTISVHSGNQFNAYSTHDDYQIIAYDNNSGANPAASRFQNFNKINVTNSATMYHRVYLGSCTERLFSSHPSNVPQITLNGTVKVTSTAGQLVKATSTLTVSGSNLSTASVTISSDKSAFKFSKTGASGSFTNTVTVDVESRRVSLTTIYVAYQPTLTTDGIEEATITVSDGAPTPTTATTESGAVQGRHLPANFVIVAKAGNNWYALPSNLSGVSPKEPTIVMVDDATNPKKATYARTTDVWHLRSVASGTRYTSYGDHVTFMEYSGILDTHHPLFATTSTTTTTGIGFDATYANYKNTNAANYEWLAGSTDLVTYSLTTDNTTQTNKTLTYNPSEQKWGMYAAGGSNIQEVRLLPIQNILDELGYSVIEWDVKRPAFAGATANNPSLYYRIATNCVAPSGAATSKACTTLTGDVFKPNSDVLSSTANADAGKTLLLFDRSSSPTKMSVIEIPYIVTSSINLAAGQDGMDVVVRDGGKITVNTTTRSIKNLNIYPGGKVEIQANKKLTIKSLNMRAGYSFLSRGSAAGSAALFKYPELYVNTGGDLAGSTYATFDYFVDADRYYLLTTPYDVSLASVVDEVGNDEFSMWIIKYNGATRASGDQVSGWERVVGSSYTFTKGVGTMVAASPRIDAGNARVQERNIAILRFPLDNKKNISTDELENKTVEVEAYGMTAGAPNSGLKENNVGWNFVGNPFTAAYHMADAGAINVGGLAAVYNDGRYGVIGENGYETQPQGNAPNNGSAEPVKWTGNYAWQEKNVRYITLLDQFTGQYTQERVSSTDKNIPPFSAFFVQVNATGELSFSSAQRRQSLPALRAQQSLPQEVELDLMLQSPTSDDHFGLLIGSDYSEQYEVGDDLAKVAIDEQMQVYSRMGGYDLAFNALNEDLAAKTIPVGYKAIENGDYVFTVSSKSISPYIESIMLTDYQEGMAIDLLYEDYEFSSTTGVFNDRFALTIRLKMPNIATDIEGQTEKGGLLDNLHISGNDHQITIVGLPEGAEIYVYDMSGKMAAHRFADDQRTHISLPQGIYNVRVLSTQGNATVKVMVD